MSRIAYVNGRYVPQSEGMVHIEDRGYQFADGIYEYIAFYNRKLLDGDLHLKRLERSVKELHIAMPMSVNSLKLVIDQLIAHNNRDDGGLYIQITRGVSRRDHAFPKNVKPALVMTLCAAKTPKEHEVKNGVKVITQPDIRWGRCDIKSVSLLANILAKQEAAKQKMREAWLFDEHGMITEGSASNTYIINAAGELITHPSDQHILGGITRDVLLKMAKKAGIPVVERAFSAEEAKRASEAFITSTSANVLPVVRIDDSDIGSGKPGPATKKLAELYLAHVLKETGKQL